MSADQRHPDENELQAFAMGLVDSQTRVALEEHLDGCSECLDVVAACDDKRAPAERRLGRFTLGELLGHGAMGGVYRAFDTQLGRDVALKVLHRPDAATLERLLVEGRAQARVHHPHVVTLFEVGMHDGVLALVLQLVEGQTLRAWQSGRSWREVLELYVQAGRGLAAAHERGVVHRDFKPDNVVVDRTGVARVTDFGLAATSSDARVAGCTPAYVAPETRDRGVCDEASDQFAFCASLCEALTGKRSLTSQTELPTPVEACLRRGLSRDPRKRFASMNELLAALERIIRPRPTWWRFGVLLAAPAVLVFAGARSTPSPCEVAEERAARLSSPSPELAASLHRSEAAFQSAFEAVCSRPQPESGLNCLLAEVEEREVLVAAAEVDPSLGASLARLADRRSSPSRCASAQVPALRHATLPSEPSSLIDVARAQALLLERKEQAAYELATLALEQAMPSQGASPKLMPAAAERVFAPPAATPLVATQRTAPIATAQFDAAPLAFAVLAARAALVRGEALAALGRSAEAVEQLHQASLLAQRAGDDELRVRAELAQVMELCRNLGATARCGEALHRAQDAALTPDEALGIELQEFEASWLGQSTRNAEAQPLLEAACAKWERLPAHGPELLRCRIALATNSETIGALDRAFEVAMLAADQARRDGASFTTYRTLRSAASIAVAAGRISFAERLVADAVALESRVNPTPAVAARLRALQAQLAERRGSLAVAIAMQRDVVEAAGTDNPGWVRKQRVVWASWLIEAGRNDEARAALQPLLAGEPNWKVSVKGDTHLAVQAHVLLAQLDGDALESARLAAWASEMMVVGGSSNRYLLTPLGVTADAQLRAKQFDAARATLDEFAARRATVGGSVQLFAAGELAEARLEARVDPVRAAKRAHALAELLRDEGSDGRFAREAEGWAAVWSPRCALLLQAEQRLREWQGLEVTRVVTTARRASCAR
ncbi:MAG: serine/threonine protein kinase [Archangium sp.]|nr:serine/threonine protein kinase [Archangium sp.]